MPPGLALCDDRHDLAVWTPALRSFRHEACTRDGTVSVGSLTSCLPLPRPGARGRVHVATYVNIAPPLAYIGW